MASKKTTKTTQAAWVKGTIGSRVKGLRIARGMTQLDLASAAGVAIGTISDLERDRVPPQKTTVVAVANALDVSAETLRGGK